MRRSDKVVFVAVKVMLVVSVVILWRMLLSPVITPPNQFVWSAVFTVAMTFVAAVAW